MPSLFDELEQIIPLPPIPEKFDRIEQLLENWQSNQLSFHSEGEPREFPQPSYQDHVQIVAGSEVPRRRNLDTQEGQGIFLHAIAHIEYSAVDLALDHAYRFRGLPQEYYDDWLITASEEARHFRMLTNLMQLVSLQYGDLPVHDGLFMAGWRSRHSLLARMATVPRYMEAGGLDAHPMLRAKLAANGDQLSQDIIAVLSIIEEEEIPHVQRGDKWFRYACEQEGVSTDCYADLVRECVPGVKFTKKAINTNARLKSGFSRDELEKLFGPLSPSHSIV